MSLKILLLVLVINVFLLGACSAPKPIQGVPDTSASAITLPPPSMEGINTHNHVFGTDADPDIITLGPKYGTNPDWPPYPNKYGMEFELEHGTPVLAPIDMVLMRMRRMGRPDTSPGTLIL